MCSSASVPQEVSFDRLIFSDLLSVTLLAKEESNSILVQFNYVRELALASE